MQHRQTKYPDFCQKKFQLFPDHLQFPGFQYPGSPAWMDRYMDDSEIEADYSRYISINQSVLFKTSMRHMKYNTIHNMIENTKQYNTV